MHPYMSDDTDDKNMHEVARNIEESNAWWLVIFGIFTKQFVAFPCFPVPPKTMAVARDPAALIQQMRRIELEFGVADAKHDIIPRSEDEE